MTVKNTLSAQLCSALALADWLPAGPPGFCDILAAAAADLRYQLHEAGPGVIGPGCPVGEGTGCTKMVTPHLDALAGESTLFMKNYVQQAVCSPTRTSLLT